MMGHLERALELLRPMLLGFETWDYCVVWKLSDSDVSRSIEWMDCCCVGGSDGESCMSSPTREDKKGFLVSTALCRDSFNPHPANKKSCLALARLPLFMPLQSEIYGEVIVSGQPRWINLPHKLAPNSFHETIGTRILIPVIGGLVELFAGKEILENQAIMEFVVAQFNDSQKNDTTQSLNYKDASFTEDRELLLSEYTNNWVDYFQQSDYKPSMIDLLTGQFSHSSSGSIPSCIGPRSLSENSSPKDQYQLKQKLELNVGCINTLATVNEISDVSHGEDKKEERHKDDKEKVFKSKNLHVERKRRARIQSGLCSLRSLVPKITKMNQTATLDDAIDHIIEMKEKVKELQKELEELERDDWNNGTKSKPSGPNGIVQFASKLDINRQDPGSNYSKIHQVEVEVYQLTMRKFLIKIVCKAKIGAFTRVLETLGYLGLQVTEVNVTSCKGRASNTFVVQAINGEIQAGELRDVLMKHACG